MVHIKKALLDFLTRLEGRNAIPIHKKRDLDKAISLLINTNPKQFTLRSPEQEKLEACLFINKVVNEIIPEFTQYPANEKLLITFLKQTDLFDMFQKNKKFILSSESPANRTTPRKKG